MGKCGSEIAREGAAMMSGESGADTPVVWPSVLVAEARVRKMQTKLHRWAVADHGFRFDDVFNFICDPATLVMAFEQTHLPRWHRFPHAQVSRSISAVQAPRAVQVEPRAGAHVNRHRASRRSIPPRPGVPRRPAPRRLRSLPVNVGAEARCLHPALRLAFFVVNDSVDAQSDA